MQKTLQIQRFHAECCKTQVLGPYHVGGGGSEPRAGIIYTYHPFSSYSSHPFSHTKHEMFGMSFPKRKGHFGILIWGVSQIVIRNLGGGFKYSSFLPLFGEGFPIWLIFSMGWFNHQLGNRHPKNGQARLIFANASRASSADVHSTAGARAASVAHSFLLMICCWAQASCWYQLTFFWEVFDVFCLHFPCAKSEIIGSFTFSFNAFWDILLRQSSKCDGARSVNICQFGWALARGFNRLWLTYTPENLSWNNGGLEYDILFSK